ncbi:MAG: signal recognition particle-docking protein FtsY [Rickettsiales bacterium]|nr:signal recognition particle-docking protein FtsY [Rickettsiales bacterium]
MSWFGKLKSALSKTSNKITTGITEIFTKQNLDQDTLLELEELLIMADLGIETAQKIVKELSKSRFSKEITIEEIKKTLAKIIEDILTPAIGKLEFIKTKPSVVLVCGVNGNGKTTTIGKIAYKYTKQNKKVIVAACDTFRAAAQEQLKIWATRSKAELVHGEQGADPASVAYRAVEKAVQDNADLVFIDTAGRLSNKKPLMDELAKINNVINKILPENKQDVILVLDATSGQNAIQQVKEFKEIVNITGLIITKLDGSAKAGIVIAIAEQFKIPILGIGIGEKIEDLDEFNAHDFAQNIVN